jgi:2-dehydro-3-deoxygluconokinase
MKTILAFGEIMGRISMPGFRRFAQSMPGTVEVDFAGAEANALVSLAQFGSKTAFVTALPATELGDACVSALAARGVGTGAIQRTDAGRLGLYFLEKGANQRAGNVVYDRDGSSVSVTPGTAYGWDALLAGASWLHLTGITSALSETAAAANLLAARKAREHGVPVSCDLNFRSKLWRWKPGVSVSDLAREQMRQLIPHVTHLLGGRDDIAIMLGIGPDVPCAPEGGPDGGAALGLARAVTAQFPDLKSVAMTRRVSATASDVSWAGFVFETAHASGHWAPVDGDGNLVPYDIRPVIDRIGTGDAFAAGMIHGWVAGWTPERTVAFATAASCLAHSIEGDANWVTASEVEALMAGMGGGRVRR